MLTFMAKREHELYADAMVRRYAHYRERHSAWIISRSVYWSIYIIVIALLLIYFDALGLTITMFLGFSLLLFAVMLIVFSLTHSLHLKFMKRYG